MTFEEKVRNNAYENPLPYEHDRKAWRAKTAELTQQFMVDLQEWLVQEGVPKRYASKVAHRAWEEGHSCGYSEVLNMSYGLVKIFI